MDFSFSSQSVVAKPAAHQQHLELVRNADSGAYASPAELESAFLQDAPPSDAHAWEALDPTGGSQT